MGAGTRVGKGGACSTPVQGLGATGDSQVVTPSGDDAQSSHQVRESSRVLFRILGRCSWAKNRGNIPY
jgi:hypothetical protein